MPWIIEDTAEPHGKNFIRKLPGGRTMYVISDDATVYRTHELATKAIVNLHFDECFMKKTGEIITYEKYMDLEWKFDSKNPASIRPSTSLVLHKINFEFIRSEPFVP